MNPEGDVKRRAGTAAAGATNTSSLNVRSNITIGVPEGTPENQKKFVEESAKKAVKKEWEGILTEGLVNTPRGFVP